MPLDETLSIGILGAASIAKKNSRAASHPSAGCKIVAIASRSKEKGEAFVAEVFADAPSAAPVVIGGDSAYSTLLDDESCEAIYIPLPTKLHGAYVNDALGSGKHVLLEKPVASSAEEYRQMLVTASRNGRLLMDGTMFVHHPRTKEFVKSIPSPTRVHFNFEFLGGRDFHLNDIRTKMDGDFMGCIGDLGWYCARMGLLVFSGSDAGLLNGLATHVQVTRHQLNDQGVPVDAECIVYFKENRVLSFNCSFLRPLNQTVQISGSSCDYTAIETDAIVPHQGDKLTFNLVKQCQSQHGEICTTETVAVECDNSLVQEVCMWRNFNEWARIIEHESTSEKSKSMACMRDGLWWSGDSSEVKEANAMASYSLHTQIVLDGLMESIRNHGSKIKLE